MGGTNALTPDEEWEALGQQMRTALLDYAEASALLKAGRELLDQMSDTGLRLNDHCEDWPVPADSRLEDFHEDGTIRVWSEHATLRRIGWIDQKGRVYADIPPQDGFCGGSLTPLLVDVREG